MRSASYPVGMYKKQKKILYIATILDIFDAILLTLSLFALTILLYSSGITMEDGVSKMVNIDHIMDLLDWNNSTEKQKQGIELAKDVKCINVFLQPCNKDYHKNVWDNCAKILAARSNEELSSYATELMVWLQDMNWPGAFCILDRLKKAVDEPWFSRAYTRCLKCAKALEDTVWESNLKMLKNED